jgi:hypothetical protein
MAAASVLPVRFAGRTTVAAPPGQVQFRIAVGLIDTGEKPWKGRITVAGGAIARLEGWRFSQRDSASADGAFEFRTKIGRLENQLRRARPFGETDWQDPDMDRLIPQGLIVRVNGGESARVRFESGAGSFEFAAAEAPFGTRLAALDGNAVIERVAVEEQVSEAGKLDDWPALALTPDGGRWAAWLAYADKADEVVVSGAGRIWRLSGRGDHHAPALASDRQGRIHAVWSSREGETFQLYTSVFGGGAWTRPERLTSGGGSNLWPQLAADGKGALALVWQGFRRNQSRILARLWNGAAWGAEAEVSEGDWSCWAPSVAFGGGRLWIAWDSYLTGAYQIYAREWSGAKPGAVHRITRGEGFSVRPAVAVTPAGIPVVAWEESEALWGKDYAFLSDRRGASLYQTRRVRVAWLESGQWRETAPAAEAVPPDVRRFIQQPLLAAGQDGRLYLAFRCRTSAGNARIDHFAGQGRWETLVTTLDGERWTNAVLMPASVGRNGMRSAIAAGSGQVHLAWATDRRVWPNVRYGDLDVMAASLASGAAPARLRGGTPVAPVAATAASPHPDERRDTQRVRAYRYAVGAKQYRILRGDLHRHTELSGDGAGDGSLDDLYRYALDAAAMDYAHVADHQMGNGEEYNWWITQKSSDLYYMPRRFTPLYGYERSVPYPNGHRNVVWAERGKPVLPISPGEARGEVNSGSLLYPYLRDTKGIATSHSSATQQGTDWRDNDPLLEPLVEIYQGFESSYEHPGAPRAWKEGQSPVHQGLRPLGYVWNAWAKGHRLGVQSSSDHVSTHVSYACILAEDFTREGLLDAMQKRHAYAATDQIVMDFRIVTAQGESLMGDIESTSSQPRLVVKVLGTAPIQHIDVIKNNTYIHKVSPGTQDANFEYVDRTSLTGDTYYYIRAEQTDGQLAWSSPIWIKSNK